MFNERQRPTAVTALLAALLLAGCHNSSSAAKPAGPRAPAVPRRDSSLLAMHVLMETNLARDAIANGDPAIAQTALGHAITFSDKLGSAVIPIYTELSNVAVLGPVQAAQHSAASEAAGNPPSKAQAVQAVTGDITGAVFDDGRARPQLLAAKQELAAGHYLAADGDLRSVQQSVIFTSVSSRLPLVRARENLGLAAQSVRDGRTAQAHAQLDAAEGALQQYASTEAGAPHAQDAAHLATTLKQSTAAARPLDAAHLDNWWDKVAAWSDQA